MIEVQAAVGAKGATPLAVPAVDPLYAGLMANVTAYEDLALDGGPARRPRPGLPALLAHPLSASTSTPRRLTDRLIAHNREHLAWA